MTTWFISRHSGALEWALQAGIQVDEFQSHIGEIDFARGDIVMGTLPVHIAAKVCEHGARFFELVVDLPEHLRGKELDVDTLKACNARLEEYLVKAANTQTADPTLKNIRSNP